MCVLRVSGSRFDADAFLAGSRLRPSGIVRTGEPRTRSRPDGPKESRSGFNVAVSDAEWSGSSGQVADACAFLDEHAAELRELRALETVEDMRLDFPLSLRIGHDGAAAQFDYFPPELVTRAGALGLGIEISLYPTE